MEKLIGLFHISRKAGKILLGKTAVLDKAKSDRSILIIVSRDAGADLIRKLKEFDFVGIDLSSDQMGEIFNRSRLSVLAITDGGLAANIRDTIKQESWGYSDPAGKSL
ncbi:MAG: hypothetical protein V3W18_08155 [candidate division Zixibacteria bacterium]